MADTQNKWTEADMGLQKVANPERELTVEFEGSTYYRYPVRTTMVQVGDAYLPVIEKYAGPHVTKGDILVMSEKFIGICQKRVIHESEINPGWLAVLISKFTKKYPDDIAWENPKKIQVAINEAGFFKSLVAVAVGGIMKFVFQKPGVFYEIMGRDIAAIDGFNPIAIPPFNEYAMLAPENPDAVCNEVGAVLGVPVVIVDASNVAIHILGRSNNVEFSDEQLVQLMAGNPMGQGREQTPLIILRKQAE